MERSKLTRSTAPLRRKSGAPTSFLGPPVSSSGSGVSSREATGSDVLRERTNTKLAVMRFNQVEKAESPPNLPIFPKSHQDDSCLKASPAEGFPPIRRHKA